MQDYRCSRPGEQPATVVAAFNARDAAEKWAIANDAEQGVIEVRERGHYKRRWLFDIADRDTPQLSDLESAYITAALWSSTDNSDEGGGLPLDTNYTAADLSPDAINTLKGHCAAFMLAHSALLEAACEATGYDHCRAGHDLWFTSNGHGAGFWDGDWGAFGDQLTNAAKQIGGHDIYIGDDGLLHIS